MTRLPRLPPPPRPVQEEPDIVIVTDSVFPDAEASTGRTDPVRVTHAIWHAAYDRLTDEQRLEVLDIVSSYLEFTREDQKEIARAITGPELRYAVREMRRSR